MSEPNEGNALEATALPRASNQNELAPTGDRYSGIQDRYSISLHNKSHVQVRDLQCVADDELAPWLDNVAH